MKKIDPSKKHFIWKKIKIHKSGNGSSVCHRKMMKKLNWLSGVCSKKHIPDENESMLV